MASGRFAAISVTCRIHWSSPSIECTPCCLTMWEQRCCSGLSSWLVAQEVRSSIPRLAAMISKIGYLLLPSRNMAEIPIERHKSSIPVYANYFMTHRSFSVILSSHMGNFSQVRVKLLRSWQTDQYYLHRLQSNQPTKLNVRMKLGKSTTSLDKLGPKR